jgi:hypothetical protein
MNKFMKSIDILSFVLLLIGGINWGLIGFFDFNLIDAIFGHLTVVSRVIYAVVGIAALYEIFTLNWIKERWTPFCREPRRISGHPVT